MRRIGFRRFPHTAILLLLLPVAGCFRGGRGEPPPSPPEAVREAVTDNIGLPPAADWIPTAVPLPEPETDNVALAAPSPPEGKGTEPAPVSAAEPVREVETVPPPGSAPATAEPVAAAPPEAAPAKPAPEKGDAPTEGKAAPERTARNGSANGGKKPSSPPPSPVASANGKEASPGAPAWAKRKEELVYRVDFIGITMGYARFRFQGKVSIGGRTAYHLNVRAWTSGMLSYIYPVNETIDYYLDAETLAPIRQEFTQREREKDDVATYDQDTGKITYRYRQTGEVRKRVDTVPMVYDPVSVAYYFRWRDLGGEERARNVYAGRKVWQISARVLGTERLQTDHGEVDTLVIRPLIRRDGKMEDKGDLKMWLSNDERRVPVRLYAKFRKIKDWTLVGELMPAKEGG